MINKTVQHDFSILILGHPNLISESGSDAKAYREAPLSGRKHLNDMYLTFPLKTMKDMS